MRDLMTEGAEAGRQSVSAAGHQFGPQPMVIHNNVNGHEDIHHHEEVESR